MDEYFMHSKTAMSDLFSRKITTAKQFMQVLTRVEVWLRNMNYLQDTSEGSVRRKPKTSVSFVMGGDEPDPKDGDAERSEIQQLRTQVSTHTAALNAVGDSVSTGVKKALGEAMKSPLSDLADAIKTLNVQMGSLHSKLGEHSVQLQLHHEQANHAGQSGSQHLVASSDPSRAQSALYALQKSYPATRSTPRSREPVDPDTIASLPQKERPYPYYFDATDYYKTDEVERAKMEKATGIDGPEHKFWKTMNVNTLPDQRCLLCGSKFHTPSHCDKYWGGASHAAKETKSEEWIESRRRLLLWNKPPEGQIASLNAVMQSAPTREEALASIAQDSNLREIIASSGPLCDAIERAPSDGGERLFALVAEWTDPRSDA